MVTRSVRSSLQESGQRARRWVLRIWTRNTRKKSQSYENLTDDANPSVSATKGDGGDLQLELRDIQASDSSIPEPGSPGPSVSGFAALGVPGAQQLQHADTPSHHDSKQGILTKQPRTTYFYDSMLSLKKESKNEEEKESARVKPWYQDKDWELYYGKKGKRKLRKKVVFQVNAGERTVDKECYVELEEEAATKSVGGEKKKKKRKRVTSSKAKKRAKRVSRPITIIIMH
jgi:hypothetical protein